jgi:excinuclease ABC subunit C
MATALARKFQERLKALPSRPGVYMFRNDGGDVIYVGKAASLKNRVRSYFGSPHSFEPKTRRLVDQIADLEYIVTRTAQEALILEATLVKRHQPFFNIRLKDDKHYPYLKIDLSEEWPRVEIARRVRDDGARYFGPFASAGSVRRSLDLVKKLFPWRSCTKAITGADPRPCLDYFINRCIGPCASLCTNEEYDAVIQQVILFLEGRSNELARDLRRHMRTASEAQEYELAARLRDQVQAIQRTTERQVMEVRDRVDMDVFGLAREGPEAYVQVFFVREGGVVGRDNFALDGAVDEPDDRVLAGFVEQFYESAAYVPKLVLLPLTVTDQALIEEWLSERRGTRVKVFAPQRGEKRQLVQRAADNAREALQVARARWLADRGKAQRALEDLQEQLNLPDLPHRIECYDISNIQGTSAVGSMVVFVDGHPRSSDYRRFRIKDVAGANDFAMMHEVLSRRFARAKRAADQAKEGNVAATFRSPGKGGPAGVTLRSSAGERGGTRPSTQTGRQGSERTEQPPEFDESFGAMPDLVIVDGGKGQVSAAHDAMRNMGIVRHHLSPRPAQEGGHALRPGRRARRRPQAQEGAPTQVRLREGGPQRHRRGDRRHTRLHEVPGGEGAGGALARRYCTVIVPIISIGWKSQRKMISPT